MIRPEHQPENPHPSTESIDRDNVIRNLSIAFPELTDPATTIAAVLWQTTSAEQTLNTKDLFDITFTGPGNSLTLRATENPEMRADIICTIPEFLNGSSLEIRWNGKFKDKPAGCTFHLGLTPIKYSLSDDLLTESYMTNKEQTNSVRLNDYPEKSAQIDKLQPNSGHRITSLEQFGPDLVKITFRDLNTGADTFLVIPPRLKALDADYR